MPCFNKASTTQRLNHPLSRIARNFSAGSLGSSQSAGLTLEMLRLTHFWQH